MLNEISAQLLGYKTKSQNIKILLEVLVEVVHENNSDYHDNLTCAVCFAYIIVL